MSRRRSDDTTFKIGRDAETGRFKPVEEARRDRDGSVVETMRRPTPPAPPKRGK
jgi:hypothetical protein